MHLVVKNHVDSFISQFDVAGPLDRQFEAFLNYVIFQSICAENIQPSELIYVGDDPGIDGIMMFINDTYVSSCDEINDIFTGKRSDSEALIVFTQAKSGEIWSKSDIAVFQSAVCDFLSQDTAYPASEYLSDRKAMFNELLRHVGKIRGGKPRCECHFAATAGKPIPREIEASRKAAETAIKVPGYFGNVKVDLVDRDKIVSLWIAAQGQSEATLPVIGTAPFPKTPGIPQGWVVTAKAADFVDNILKDQDGRLRTGIFDENVRDFIGMDSEINSEISNTLVKPDQKSRFGILNNGITIISTDVRNGSLEVFL